MQTASHAHTANPKARKAQHCALTVQSGSILRNLQVFCQPATSVLLVVSSMLLDRWTASTVREASILQLQVMRHVMTAKLDSIS
jgi:hypothetical protein